MNDAEIKRNALERDLYNRRELYDFTRGGMQIIIHWLRRSNTISMTLVEEHQERWFAVPNDSVLDSTVHPEFYAAKEGQYRQ